MPILILILNTDTNTNTKYWYLYLYGYYTNTKILVFVPKQISGFWFHVDIDQYKSLFISEILLSFSFFDDSEIVCLTLHFYVFGIWNVTVKIFFFTLHYILHSSFFKTVWIIGWTICHPEGKVPLCVLEPKKSHTITNFISFSPPSPPRNIFKQQQPEYI